MKILITSFIICIFSWNVSIAQDEHYDKQFEAGQYKVIAPGGLFLRDKPSTNSNTLRLIPFGSYVDLIHKDSYDYDTISHIDFCTQGYQVPVFGHWIKVKYQEQSGFMFSAYLIHSRTIKMFENYRSEHTQEYGLFRSGTTCVMNFDHRPEWNHYGLYIKDSIVEIKSINKVSFTYIDQSFLEYTTHTNQDCNLEFIISAPKELTVGVIKTKHHPKISFDDFSNVDIIKSDTEADHLKRIAYKDRVFVNHKLMEEHYQPYILFCGDIDHDGINDYIIQYGEKSIEISLYLSSEQKVDGKYIPSASYYSGYCC